MRIPIFDQISWGLKPDTGKNTGSGMIRNPLNIDSTFYEILRQSKKVLFKTRLAFAFQRKGYSTLRTCKVC